MFIKSLIALFSKYDGKKVLKISENSAVTEIDDPGIDLPEHSKQCVRNSVKETISMIELDIIKPRFFKKIL